MISSILIGAGFGWFRRKKTDLHFNAEDGLPPITPSAAQWISVSDYHPSCLRHPSIAHTSSGHIQNIITKLFYDRLAYLYLIVRVRNSLRCTILSRPIAEDKPTHQPKQPPFDTSTQSCRLHSLLPLFPHHRQSTFGGGNSHADRVHASYGILSDHLERCDPDHVATVRTVRWAAI